MNKNSPKKAPKMEKTKELGMRSEVASARVGEWRGRGEAAAADDRVGGRESERERVAVEGGEGEEEDGRCEDGGSVAVCCVRLKRELGFRPGAASQYIGY
jgi:hypothetical protein